MRPLLFVGLCVVLAFGVRSAQAVECSPEPREVVVCEPDGPNRFDGYETKKSPWFFGGHLEAGIYENEYGRKMFIV